MTDVFFNETSSIKIQYIIISLIIGAGFTYLYKLKMEKIENTNNTNNTNNTKNAIMKYIFVCLIASFVSLLFMTSFSMGDNGETIAKKLNAKEMHTGEPNF